MIAKRVPAPKKKSNFVKLVNYMVDVKKQGNKKGKYDVERLAFYMSQGDEAQVRISNCSFDDIAAAAKEIDAVQKLNTTSNNDKTYHLVISFKEGENPGKDVLDACEDHIVNKIGYEGHQRISAIHTNTDHLHIHVAINKVHPEKFQNIEPYYDKFKMSEACRELEKKYGLQVDRGAEKRSKRPMNAAVDKENQTGIKSFVSWIRENVEDEMILILSEDTPSWQTLHDKLDEYGMEIRARGAGMVFQSTEGGQYCKLSSVSRDFSKAKLEKILGDFVESEKVSRPTPKEFYKRQPTQEQSSERNTLWLKYEKERAENLKIRKEAFGKIREEKKIDRERLTKNIEKRKKRLEQDILISRADKAKAKRNLYRQKKIINTEVATSALVKSERLDRDNPLLTWLEFLQKEGDKGNVDALKVLRRKGIDKKLKGNHFHSKTNKFKELLFDDLKYSIDRKGRVHYEVKGHEIVDYGRKISPGSLNDTVIEAGLKISVSKFGRNLNVAGDKPFQDKVKKVAKKKGMNLTINGERVLQRVKKEVSVER